MQQVWSGFANGQRGLATEEAPGLHRRLQLTGARPLAYLALPRVCARARRARSWHGRGTFKGRASRQQTCRVSKKGRIAVIGTIAARSEARLRHARPERLGDVVGRQPLSLAVVEARSLLQEIIAALVAINGCKHQHAVQQPRDRYSERCSRGLHIRLYVGRAPVRHFSRKSTPTGTREDGNEGECGGRGSNRAGVHAGQPCVHRVERRWSRSGVTLNIPVAETAGSRRWNQRTKKWMSLQLSI